MNSGPTPPAKAGFRRVALFACGHPDRGDDSVGARAVERLAPETRALADVCIVGALGPELLVGLPLDVAVLIVDAVVGVEPGHIVDVDLDDLSTLSEHDAATTTHQLPLDGIVALAGLLREHPLEGRFLGMGIDDVSPGAALSPAVLASLPKMARTIDEAVSHLVGNERDSPEQLRSVGC